VYPVVLGEFGDHDDRWRPLLPDHRPEVVDGVGHRTLSRDVRTRLTAVALTTTTTTTTTTAIEDDNDNKWTK